MNIRNIKYVKHLQITGITNLIFKLSIFCSSDPRFIIGVLLFVTGYIINKWADLKLRSMRTQRGKKGVIYRMISI